MSSSETTTAADIEGLLLRFIRKQINDAMDVAVTVHERSGAGDSHENWAFDLAFNGARGPECRPLL
jgi:hypothetical protein